MFPAGQNLVINKCLACLVLLLNPREEMESHTDNFPFGLEFKPFLLRTKCSKASLLAVELSLICCPRTLESQTVLLSIVAFVSRGPRSAVTCCSCQAFSS